MKTSFWKILVMCLVLAAIPLKGMAMSIVAVCKDHQQSLHTTKVSSSTPCHGHGAAANTDADADASHHYNQNHGHSHSDTSHLKCGACSSCCAGSVIATSGFVVLPEFKTPFYIFYYPPQHRAPDLNRLDRPPRQHLA